MGRSRALILRGASCATGEHPLRVAGTLPGGARIGRELKLCRKPNGLEDTNETELAGLVAALLSKVAMPVSDWCQLAPCNGVVPPGDAKLPANGSW